MNLFDDDNIPTPEECIMEGNIKNRLKALEQEYAQRKATVDALRNIEQTMRANIVRLSDTLSQLYSLSGALAGNNLSAASIDII